MRDRKKRNIIIGSLCCLLVFMGIGYAILSQTLNISGIANMRGNWNVKITNMELLSENKTGRAEEVSHSFTDTTATFEANLYMPGDSIEYRVTVENQGNIDALLKSITPTTTNRSEGIKFSHSEIDNTVLTAGKKITFTMKVEFLEDATSIPNVENVKYNLELVYVQYNGGEYTPAVETTEDDCFMISDDGTLATYDKSCGVDVVIPAKINNIPVKRTSPYFLMSNGFVMGFRENNPVYIFMNKNKLNEFVEQAKKNGSTAEEIEEIKTTSVIWDTVDKSTLNLMSASDYLKSSADKSKIYKDSTGTIKLDSSSGDDYNIISGSGYTPYSVICMTNDACDLIKEYYRNQDPAKREGITDNSYYEYFLQTYALIDDFNYSLLMGSQGLAVPSDITINSMDFSNAIYMDSIMGVSDADISGQLIPIKKVVMPPNIESVGAYSVYAEEVYFPNNSVTKIISSSAFSTPSGGYISAKIKKIALPKTLKVIGDGVFRETDLGSITIPASVVRIGYGAFQSAGLTSLSFETGSNLIAMYGNTDRLGYSFQENNLSSITIPKSVEYIGDSIFYGNKLTTLSFETGSKLKYIGTHAFGSNQLTNTGLSKLPSSLTSLAANAFSNNPSLTQITLTSPTDLEGWTNGSTVDGKTVVYER